MVDSGEKKFTRRGGEAECAENNKKGIEMFNSKIKEDYEKARGLIRELNSQIGAKAELEARFSRAKDLKGQVLQLLGGVDEGHAAWMGLHLVLAHQIRLENQAAKLPGISNDARNYNTGRAAALEDFQGMLRQLLAESRMVEEEAETVGKS